MFSQAKISLEARTIRSTTQIRVVTRRQHRISALAETSGRLPFRAETSGRLRAVYHFSFRFSESNARGRERQSRETRETRASHARGHLRVSCFARRTTEKRETARSLTSGRVAKCLLFS